jgi:hypothetical protein
MPPFVFITTQIMLFLGVYLIVMGWTGVISGTAFIDRSPFSLRRPTTYLLVAWVIFLKPLTSVFGEPVAQGVFLFIGAIVIIETVRPLVVASINITGASPEVVDAELRHAFSTLGVKYAGEYPNYKLKSPWARLQVKYRQQLGEAKITIYPSSQRPLLTKIENIVERDLGNQERPDASRGFIYDVVEGLLLISIAAWKISTAL